MLDVAVGKSSLLSRFQGQGFGNGIVGQTFGLDQRVFSVRAGGTHVNLAILDTSGGKRYLSITKPYFRGSAGAFLVYDVTQRETFDHLDRWLKELRENNKVVTSQLSV